MSNSIFNQLFFQLFDVVVLLLRIFHLFLLPGLWSSHLLSQNFDLVVMFEHSSLKFFLSSIIFQLLLIVKRIFSQHRKLMFQFIKMTRFLFENVFKSRHLISDQPSRLFGFQIVNLPLIIFDLLVHILQLFFDGISWRFCRNQFMLLFGGSIFIFLFIKHFIDFDDLVFQLAVSFLQLCDVFGPK